MKQARVNGAGGGMNSRLYLQPNSPLKTVFEDTSPEPDSSPSKQLEKLTQAPRKLHRFSPSNGRRPRPQYLQLSGLTRTPSALLHNDWYLNQLYNEVLELYRPGTLTGFRLHSRSNDSDRRLSLLRNLAPGCRINPLLPSQPHSVERLRQIHQPGLTEHRTEPFHLSMPPKRKASNTAGSSKTPKGKRPTGRKDLLEDESHIFSAKSKLVQEDLTQFFANPLAWSLLADDEKEEIRNLLPPGIPYDESGAPSQEFLRYDNDWRNHVRLFAEDVEAGRYEPEWLEEAKAASEARRRGDFDRWKEDQFEEFWGQKSDAHADLMAGEAVKIRLGEMVATGLFRVGDVFIYVRSFGKGRDGYLVEKESTIVEISRSTLTFTMPPGTLRRPPKPIKSDAKDTELKSNIKPRSRSDEVGLGSPRVSQPPEEAKRRSSSLQSGKRGSNPPSGRPGTSDGDVADKDPKPNKKRFGILGSFRRQSSEEKEQSSGGIFKLRRKPVPKMEIVPPNLGLTDDSDSPLSSLPSDDEDQLFSQPPFPNAISDKTHGSTKDSDKSSFAATPKSTSMSPEKHIFPRRPLPNRSHSESVPQLQTASRKRPSTSGSNASSGEPKPTADAVVPARTTSRRLPSRKASNRETQKSGSQASVQRQDGHVHGIVTGGDTEEEEGQGDGNPNDRNGDNGGSGGAGHHLPLVTVSGVDSLHTLEQKVLEVDGRRKGEPRANAWRTFRCLRGGLNLGTLWDMREEYYKAKYG